jgi:hypothetical protein
VVVIVMKVQVEDAAIVVEVVAVMKSSQVRAINIEVQVQKTSHVRRG